jgi:hypothetical protein
MFPGLEIVVTVVAVVLAVEDVVALADEVVVAVVVAEVVLPFKFDAAPLAIVAVEALADAGGRAAEYTVAA